MESFIIIGLKAWNLGRRGYIVTCGSVFVGCGTVKSRKSKIANRKSQVAKRMGLVGLSAFHSAEVRRPIPINCDITGQNVAEILRAPMHAQSFDVQLGVSFRKLTTTSALYSNDTSSWLIAPNGEY
jgi:hypothetical protein